MSFSQLLLVLGSAAVFASGVRGADEPGLGLRFATPEQLRGVPLAYTPFSGAELPRVVDLSARLPAPGQQGRQNSCVAWTVAYALKSYQEFEEEKVPYLRPDGGPDLSRHFSPAFIYNQINGGRDGGSLFIDALNVLSQTGAVPLSVMPYDEGDFTRRPTAGQLAGARIYRIDTWRQVNVSDIKEVKAQLNAGYPVAIGAVVDEGLTHLRDGEIWNAVRGEQRGGHAMLVVGYDDDRSAFKLLNSWGREWGSSGYGWVDYRFFPVVVREGYVAKDAKNGAGPAVVTSDEPPAPPPVISPSPDPRPVPAAVVPGQLRVLRVDHNQNSPAGLAFVVYGDLSVQPGTVGILQVVVHIYMAGPDGQKGAPVGSLWPAFASTQGTAATGTAPWPLNGMGVNDQPWYAYFPYQALNLIRGYQHGYTQPYVYQLVAEPVLYINNFGVASGGLIRFPVGL